MVGRVNVGRVNIGRVCGVSVSKLDGLAWSVLVGQSATLPVHRVLWCRNTVETGLRGRRSASAAGLLW